MITILLNDGTVDSKTAGLLTSRECWQTRARSSRAGFSVRSVFLSISPVFTAESREFSRQA
jgi:hypothetical protein